MYRVQPLAPPEPDPSPSASPITSFRTPPAPRRTIASGRTTPIPTPHSTSRSLSHSQSTPSFATMLPIKSAGPSSTLVAVALVCLCVQNSALVLSMKYTRSVLKEAYLTSTAVVVMECVKFALSWAMMLRDGARTKDVMCQLAPHRVCYHNATSLRTM